MRTCLTRECMGSIWKIISTVSVCIMAPLDAEESSEILERLNQLEQQNSLLLELVTKQQTEIDNLQRQLNGVDQQTNQQSADISELKHLAQDFPTPSEHRSESKNIHISGEAGIIFRAGETNTNFPNEEFKVDEARITVEAQVHEGIYLVSELELQDRENLNADVELGEFFLEFEDLFDNNALSVRAGRLLIPFGEEYQTRYVMENALINHSVSDFWGLDEGVEAFGHVGEFSYIAAIMNGSHDFLRDYTSSKALVGRVGYDPIRNLHLSGSVMRTGTIDVEKEGQTELWFGNSFFRSIGSEATTEFHVDLAQLDASYFWDTGHLSSAYGKAWYDDNDPLENNRRIFDFWQIETQQSVLRDTIFAAIRYSGMNVDEGYPVSGMAARGPYFFGPFKTTELRRLSIGLTYWPYPDLVLKLDYTMEDGEQTNGSKRSDTNMLAAEVGARF